MLKKNSFVVKEQAKMFSLRKNYDIFDGQTGEAVGSANQKVSGLMAVLGPLLGKDRVPVTLEVRTKDKDEVAFIVRRRGLLFKKVEVADAQGQLLGRCKAKAFTLTGGFHVYDKDGKHFAEVKGRWLKAEYQFVKPGDKAAMGTVSKKWGGLAKELFTSASTFGVQFDAEGARGETARRLILGAALAIDALFPQAKTHHKSGLQAGGDE
jgi:uncharacterized protein YxjI